MKYPENGHCSFQDLGHSLPQILYCNLLEIIIIDPVEKQSFNKKIIKQS